MQQTVHLSARHTGGSGLFMTGHAILGGCGWVKRPGTVFSTDVVCAVVDDSGLHISLSVTDERCCLMAGDSAFDPKMKRPLITSCRERGVTPGEAELE